MCSPADIGQELIRWLLLFMAKSDWQLKTHVNHTGPSGLRIFNAVNRRFVFVFAAVYLENPRSVILTGIGVTASLSVLVISDDRVHERSSTSRLASCSPDSVTLHSGRQ